MSREVKAALAEQAVEYINQQAKDTERERARIVFSLLSHVHMEGPL